MIRLIILFLLLGKGFSIFASGTDSSKSRYRDQHYFDLSASYSQKQFASALSWSHLHGFGKKKQRFKIGYGVRFSSFVAANKFYTTAPSKFTSPVQNLGTIFSETIEENIDTIAIQTPQVNMLNLSIHLQYTFKNKLDLGFNIDALGFSFGSTKTANVISSSFDPGQSPVLSVKPTVFNLLLTSDNDIGSLNSEFYLRYWLNEKWAVRTGLTFMFTEYTTETKLSFDSGRIENDRYRLKSSMFLLAVSYRPFAN